MDPSESSDKDNGNGCLVRGCTVPSIYYLEGIFLPLGTGTSTMMGVRITFCRYNHDGSTVLDKNLTTDRLPSYFMSIHSVSNNSKQAYFRYVLRANHKSVERTNLNIKVFPYLTAIQHGQIHRTLHQRRHCQHNPQHPQHQQRW